VPVETLLLTHTDLDGVGCGVLFSGSRPGQGTVELVDNGAIDARVRDALEGAPAILVTDHGIDTETADRVDAYIAAGGHFTLLDHHRSSQHLAERAWAHITEVERAGGMSEAIEQGIPKLRIEEAAARTQARIDSGAQAVIGVNTYRLDDEDPFDVRRVDNDSVYRQQIEKLEAAVKDGDFTELFRLLGTSDAQRSIEANEEAAPEYTSVENTVVEAVLKADPTGYIVRHPFINRQLQRLLAKWAFKLCTSGGFLMPGFTLADLAKIIEERARSELGMIRHDEVFFQLPQDSGSRAPAASERPDFPAR